ncbi:MAG TPA: hypothetical protein VK153_02785 [Candidatus Paceibacterota bacterium]|nr:hypothetical protein [Candidatus Paceibacterota bacterium]
MSNKLFRVEILQPRFNELYEEYLSLFGEENNDLNSNFTKKTLFPNSLIESLPTDVGEICKEFNFSFSLNKPFSSMLLLRRLLPLSIVRKFQKMGKENEIKQDGDYFDTKVLLGKVQIYLKEKRVYEEIISYKLLLDSSQHSYTFHPVITDVEGAAVKLRLLLEDIFT